MASPDDKYLLPSDDYSNLSIKAGPLGIQNTAKQIVGLVTDILNDLQDVYNALDQLNLSWYGKSQQEANSFNQRWKTAIATLFGTTKNPEKGVLNQLTMALALA